MAKFLGELELIQVNVEEENTKTTFKFLHDEKEELYEVTLFQKLYDKENGEWKEDEIQQDKYNEYLDQYLHVTPETIFEAVGKKFPVWEGEKFNYLWEPREFYQFPPKFDQYTFDARIEDIKEYTTKAVIELFIPSVNKYVRSNINWSEWVPVLQKSLVNPQKKRKQMRQFEEKFHVPFEERGMLVGEMVQIEINKYNFAGKTGTWVKVKPIQKELDLSELA